MMMSGYNINDLIQEAQFRWLRPGEVLFILENYEETQLNHEPPQKPPSGSMFLFNKRVLRFFRKDGHSWRRKKDGKNVGEAHERLKVGNVEALNCYYAHGEENPNFQRRCYWMLDSAMEHIVLVHYRDITIGKHSAGPLTLGSSNIIQSSNTQLILSAAVTNSSSNSISNSISNGTERIEEIDASPDLQINQALKRLEEQLSLEHIHTFYSDEFTINDQNYSQDYGHYNDEFTIPSQQTLILKDMVTYDGDAACDDDSYVYPSNKNEVLSTQIRSDPVEYHHSNGSSILPCKEVEDSTFPSYFPETNMYHSDVDLYSSLFDQGQIETPLASDSSLTISQEQKFTIREISPEWGYATEPTKVVIVGRFTCDPSDSEWICMFGETEVPVEIIQEGVICCYAPPHPPGKVTICITSGNREACSEVREFEYRHKPLPTDTNLTQTKTPGELLLLVKFVQMLLSDKIGKNGKSNEISLAGEDSWAEIIEGGSDSLEPSGTTDWLLEQLVKDKLQQWLSLKPVLSKKEQGIIHVVSGLGFVWALEPILKSGIGINFRDLNGWTALHWASRFGREKMVAELVARGAYAGAVTDPSQQDPTGKTAACIAETYGHKGLAGYLSEVALTSHLSSLTLKESELSKGSADVEAERTVNSIDFVSEDHLSLKDAIAAVRNSAQAASRIQAAFRAHSFKKRKQKEAEYDELGYILKHDDHHHHHHAALSIQKKYRGYKGRKDFLTLRQKVVRIQAHVRGHQARKNYETICWAVGIVEKVILRWHRKGVGLRGFHLDSVDENEEDVVKVFRKQKVDVALSEAVSRVLSMVNSTQARQQYRRMLLKYQQAKAERGGLESGVSASQYDATGMETEDFYGTI